MPDARQLPPNAPHLSTPAGLPATAAAAAPTARYTVPQLSRSRQPSARDSFPSVGLLFIRLVLAADFVFHGSQIAFHLWGGPGPAAFSAAHHWPQLVGWLVGIGEIGAGLSMLTGVFFPLGTFIIMVVMAGAIATVHLHHGFDLSQGGMEYALTLLVVAIGLALTGPGIYTLPAAFADGTHEESSMIGFRR